MAIHSKYIAELLGFTIQGANKWRREGKKIISFLELFSEDEIEEFLETGKIRRLEESKSNSLEYMIIENVRFNLKQKLDQLLLKPAWHDLLSNIFPKKIFLDILEKMQDDPVLNIEKHRSKEYLISKIDNYKVVSINNANKKKLIELIDKNLSNMECYVLIKYNKEII